MEGFGIVFQEAAAFGVPSIAGADGGTGDAVIAGETGLIVDGEEERAIRDATFDCSPTMNCAARWPRGTCALLGASSHGMRRWRVSKRRARMTALLDDRAVVALSGPGCAHASCRASSPTTSSSLLPGRALYAALLTPQGKILFDFLISEGDGAVLLDCAAASAEALAKRLTMYRLRAKVEIGVRPQLAVVWGEGLDGSAPCRTRQAQHRGARRNGRAAVATPISNTA